MESLRSLENQLSPQYLPLDLTKEEFDTWKSSHVTQEVIKVFYSLRLQAIQRMGLGETLRNDPGITAQATAKVVGLIEGYDAFLLMELGDIVDRDEEEGDNSNGK